MNKIIVGGLAILIGVTGFSFYFSSFLSFLAGALPLLLILGGALAAYLGYTDVQAEKEEKEESVTYLEDEPEPAQAPEAEPESTPPAAGTTRAAAETVTAYKGNADTQVFHAITCKFASGKKCTENFTTRQAALDQGYKPCKVCNP